MEIRNLGRSGLRVSTIGVGCNNFGGRIDETATKAVIHKALDLASRCSTPLTSMANVAAPKP